MQFLIRIFNLDKKFMSILRPFNIKKWIDGNRHLLKPPVNNKVVYRDAEFIVMIVGGPNSRKDFHYNESEEFFFSWREILF